MTPDPPKRLRMFAGPNGSGKTSLVYKLAKEFSAQGLFQLHRFVNADDILRLLRSDQGILLDLGYPVTAENVRGAILAEGRLAADHPILKAIELQGDYLRVPAVACDDYAAAAIADFLREALLARGRSFSFETVMSHPNKIDFFARARATGYRTYFYFIATDSPSLNIRRVENRSALGGHDVPENKIIERYQRCLQLVGSALSHAYRAFLFDNSGAAPVWLAQQTPDGITELRVADASLPVWFKTWVLPHIKTRS